ncbi:hypothetical protein [Deinococcus sp.]|uniref:hypothetical protein n=1 Tax=Deinococcus sp. TaxID=47478 RepID=UPI003C7C7CE8
MLRGQSGRGAGSAFVPEGGRRGALLLSNQHLVAGRRAVSVMAARQQRLPAATARPAWETRSSRPVVPGGGPGR